MAKENKEQTKNKRKSDYTAEDIYVLEGLDRVFGFAIIKLLITLRSFASASDRSLFLHG